MPSTYVAGFPPELWADLFQECSEILEPLLPWLNQELSELLRARWWEVALAQSVIVANLCYHGLSQEALVRELQSLLQEQTAAFVHRLIDTAAERCSDEILRRMDLLNSHADEQEQEEQEQEEEEPQEVEEQQGPTAIPTSLQETPTPIPSSSDSPAVSSVEGDTGTLEATFCHQPSCFPSVPVPAEQQQPQEEPSETGAAAGAAAPAGAAARAGPSAQRCRRSPVSPGQDRDCLPEEPRRPTKRKASGPRDSPQPPKRPSRRQWLRPRKNH